MTNHRPSQAEGGSKCENEEQEKVKMDNKKRHSRPKETGTIGED